MRSSYDEPQEPETMEVEERSLHLTPVSLPNPIEESSIDEMTELNEDSVVPGPEFVYIPRGSERGKDLLVEVPGYSYTVRKISDTTRFWWCSVRRQGHRCPASISERNGLYTRGAHRHSHPEDPGCLVKRQLSRQVKDSAAENVFQSAMLVVEEKLQSLPTQAVCNLPNPDILARQANRFRQKQRPEDPRTMDFELDHGHLPEDFLRSDITVGGARHLIFSTQYQLDVLSRAKTWYLDGTFKVIKRTDVFDQLFGIHAFIKKDGEAKQVPLVFVFMSRRRKKDYKKVLKKVKTLLPSVSVQSMVLDFEAAVWSAIRSVYPTVKINGCAFHWTQAVWKKVQACGLTTSYNEGGDVQKMLRRLLALPLLPSQHIPIVFERERRKAEAHSNLSEVYRYVNEQWICNVQWKPEDWSVYGLPIRTNNDCEGWHRRLNTRISVTPPFYVLVNLLKKESMFVQTQSKLVSVNKLKKRQRNSTTKMEGKIFSAWGKYSEGDMSADKLLKKLSRVYSK